MNSLWLWYDQYAAGLVAVHAMLMAAWCSWVIGSHLKVKRRVHAKRRDAGDAVGHGRVRD